MLGWNRRMEKGEEAFTLPIMGIFGASRVCHLGLRTGQTMSPVLSPF